MIRVDQKMTNIVFAVVGTTTCIVSLVQVINYGKKGMMLMPLVAVVMAVAFTCALFENRTASKIRKKQEWFLGELLIKHGKDIDKWVKDRSENQ